jgi:hypothetical protein
MWSDGVLTQLSFLIYSQFWPLKEGMQKAPILVILSNSKVLFELDKILSGLQAENLWLAGIEKVSSLFSSRYTSLNTLGLIVFCSLAQLDVKLKSPIIIAFL